ncbi:NADH dehydrogenase [ubiquinone] 1 beta subcomplex subunit 11, mitochondrial [Phymastichus coffea]|uniref:NADH dehydrogenase [ubiquinone] 1 beta subcomplex subunit 11, mitochondrial n=1 Tax=Phymastichus coffea TaxID=108790 RepID=UPI00273C515F|nr:NADH dehydrogenase [ubiquinone] 1 beta subcomplex subunit 11, mitochondrial [Phymastichus coffea]
MSGLLRFQGIRQVVSRLVQRRSVGTSNAKKSDTITTTPSITTSTSTAECTPKKNWISYGFSDVSQDLDRHLMHLSFFVGISILFTLGGYVIIYMPDFKMKDWYQREGYIELRRRERLGLPKIDINLVDPAKVKLPSDEELRAQNIEIII